MRPLPLRNPDLSGLQAVCEGYLDEIVAGYVGGGDMNRKPFSASKPYLSDGQRELYRLLLSIRDDPAFDKIQEEPKREVVTFLSEPPPKLKISGLPASTI